MEKDECTTSQYVLSITDYHDVSEVVSLSLIAHSVSTETKFETNDKQSQI